MSRILLNIVFAPFRLAYYVLMAIANWCEKKAGGGK